MWCNPPTLFFFGLNEEKRKLCEVKYTATLTDNGHRTEFFRHLGFFENWSATYISMNFVSGMPVLFGFAMETGGPKAAFANWTMIGGYVSSHHTCCILLILLLLL